MVTAIEAKAENIEKMGQSLGEQYSALWQELASLHIMWSEYVELFGRKESRIDLLNKSAPAFFGMIQNKMWEWILLHLSRLTDPQVSPGKKQNLTIHNLSALVDEPQLKSQLLALIAKAEAQTAFCRDWRNRHIAHNDLDLAMERSTKPLQTGSRADVNAALKSIGEVLNAISAAYQDSETAFDAGTRIGGALELLYLLHEGIKEQERRQQRIANGEWDEDDMPVDI